MANTVAIQDEIASLDKKLAEVQGQLDDARSRLEKAKETSQNGQVGDDLSHEEKMALIQVNLQEVLNPEIMEEALKKNGHLKVYWGTATTGRPHCGYFVPILKIAQFLAAGCHVKVLLADIHGFLDNLKAPIELVKYRAEYYRSRPSTCPSTSSSSCSAPATSCRPST
jgi:tyrosyl-tRNA synthetase